MELKKPLFKLGDKIFLVKDNCLVIYDRGEVGCFPRIPSRVTLVTYPDTNIFAVDLEQNFDFSRYYDENSDFHKYGEFAEDGSMYAFHMEVNGLDTIYYLMYLSMFGRPHKYLVPEKSMVKVKTPLFQPGDKVFLF